MKIRDVEHGTSDWLKLRIGKVTASELSNLLTPDFKPRTGEMPYSYLCEKLAELWRGQPLPAFGAWATDQGLILEEEALPFLQLEYDWHISRVGFIESDDGLSGCSPDGLLSVSATTHPHEGIEIKCPSPQVHVKYLLNGTVPKEYLAQVHGSMFVTGFKSWKFMSYRRGFPPLMVTVGRDEEIMKKIAIAVGLFHGQLNEAREQIGKL